MNDFWGLRPFVGIMIWTVFWTAFGLIMSRIRWGRRHWHRDVNKSPMDVLKERYAKGEINKQEFEEKKRDLA